MIKRLTFVPLLLACGGEPRAVIDEPSSDVEVPAGLAIRFRGDVVGVPLEKIRFAWAFGGTTAEGPVAGHTFTEAGDHIVRLRVLRGTDTTPLAETERTIRVSAAVPAGNYALRFFGSGRDDIDRAKLRVDDPRDARAGPPADIGATDFTIEFWIRADSGVNQSRMVECGANVAWINGNVVLDRDRYGQNRKFGLSIAGGRPVFGVTGASGGDLTICGTRRIDDGAWHHVAVTRQRGTGALALFVDGQRDASAERGPAGDVSYPDNGRPQNSCGGPCDRSDPFLVIGAEKHDVGPDYPSFRGDLDELRLSTVIRYRGGFAVPTAPFQPDEATAGLYHFDEGAGELALDSSTLPGGPTHVLLRRGGTMKSPLWVSSSVPFKQASR